MIRNIPVRMLTSSVQNMFKLLIATFLYLTSVVLAAESTKAMTPLDRAFVTATQNPKEEAKYYDIFLNTEIYLPTYNLSDKEREKRAGAGESIQPVIIESEGVRYVMLFDSKERLGAWAKREIGFVRLPGHAFVEMAGSDIRWALNVGTDYQKVFLPDEIRWLKQSLSKSQVKETKIAAGTQVLVGVPAKIPPGLLNSFKSRLPKNREVKEAYLAQVYYVREGEKPHLAIGLRIDKTSNSTTTTDAIKKDLATASRSHLAEGEYIDILTQENEPLFSEIIKVVKPFYERGR